MLRATGINVVDVESSKILENMTVKIKGGKIASISKATKSDMQESGYSSVDAAGLYVCPGLIDCKLFITSLTDTTGHTHITVVPGVTVRLSLRTALIIIGWRDARNISSSSRTWYDLRSQG